MRWGRTRLPSRVEVTVNGRLRRLRLRGCGALVVAAAARADQQSGRPEGQEGWLSHAQRASIADVAAVWQSPCKAVLLGRMDFAILGPVEARLDGSEVALGGPKQRALLTVLLLARNEIVSRDRLVEALWGERAPPTVQRSLDSYVSRLRRLLGENRIERRAPGYLLRVEPGELDLDRFERLLAEARDASASGDRSRALEALEAALSVWRGPALADLLFEPFARARGGAARGASAGRGRGAARHPPRARRGRGAGRRAGSASCASSPWRERLDRAAHAGPLPRRTAGRRARGLPRRAASLRRRSWGWSRGRSCVSWSSKSLRRTRPWLRGAGAGRSRRRAGGGAGRASWRWWPRRGDRRGRPARGEPVLGARARLRCDPPAGWSGPALRQGGGADPADRGARSARGRRRIHMGDRLGGPSRRPHLARLGRGRGQGPGGGSAGQPGDRRRSDLGRQHARRRNRADRPGDRGGHPDRAAGRPTTWRRSPSRTARSGPPTPPSARLSRSTRERARCVAP